MRHLCDVSATLDIADERGKSPIWCAAWYGHVQVVRILLKAEASPNCYDCDERTPLHATCDVDSTWSDWRKLQLRNPEVARLLLDARADTNHSDRYGCSPLIAACQNGLHKHVRLLCEGGAIVHQTDVLNRTALHWASMYGFIRIVRILIDAGGFKDPADVDGMTCLNAAHRFGHKGVAVFLRRSALDKTRKGCLRRIRRRLGKQ